jgi:hypothetical protein
MVICLILLLIDGGRCDPGCRADVIEMNHCYDQDTERHKFTQVIIWNWKPEVGRHHVDFWWIVDTQCLAQLPLKCNDICKVRRRDGLVISSKVYRETWTLNDPESDDRKLWHESRRCQK